MRTAGPGLGSLIRNTLAGILPAPDQYRIGLSLLMHFWSYTLTSGQNSPFR